MEHVLLSPARRIRVFTVGIAAAVSLYGMVMLLAEPLHALAAADAENVAVNLTVASTITNTCTTPVSLGTINGTGDTGAYNSGRATACTVITNNSEGYTLAWKVTTGSGGTNTGKMISQFEDTIAAYTPAADSTPETWSVAAAASEWGGRLSSTSTTVNTGTWGTDASSEKWLNVGTGSYTIATRSTETAGGGDTENVGFRSEIGASKIQPTGNYTVTVVLTATTQ